MHILRWFSCATVLLLFGNVAFVTAESQCVEECIRSNQMASVGFEIIQGQCSKECNFEEILSLLKSPQKEAYKSGVIRLSESNDRRAVQPLVVALKRDIKERTGLWSWIIPALGALGDQTAVPVLIHTLTLYDDDWIGREMSASALGSIGDPSCVPYLLTAAWRADTRDAAIEALVKFKDDRIVPVLLSALDPEEYQDTRDIAVNGLYGLGVIAVPQMIEAFADYSSEHPETSKRLLLCQLLSTSGDKRALEVIQKSITDPDKAVRECADNFFKVRK